MPKISLILIFLTISIIGCDKKPKSHVEPTPVPDSRPPEVNSPKFKEGFVSFNFDDGRPSSYNNGVPVLDAKGFKSTNYIITGRFSAPGYIGINEILSLQSRGHEIGAHTKSHQDLTLMTGDQIAHEVGGSKQDLLNIGVRSVETFAYPFGLFNETVLNTVRITGYIGARGTNGGFNDRLTNKLILRRQNLGSSTTMAQVRDWVDSAGLNKTWLIFVAHNIDMANNDFAVTPQFFREIVDYVESKRIKVIIMSEGIRMMIP